MTRTGSLAGPRDYVRGSVNITGSMADAHSGNDRWHLQERPTGTSTWQTLCTVDQPPQSPSCEWNTAQATAGR
jgi:hypothetical protein